MTTESLPGASLVWVGASGHTYALYQNLKTWSEANSYAISLGGYLAKVETSSENAEIYNKVNAVWSATAATASYAPDGGMSSYVWLGASDSATEGSWKWAKDGSTLNISRPEWGSGGGITEPDNSGGIQDYLAMGMETWPWVGLNLGFVIGNPGDWNDITGTNRLYFVVEKEATASDTTKPTVSTFSPADGAIGVAVGSNIVLTFSEAIKKGTGNIEIHSGSASGPLVESFNVATSSKVTISGSTLTIDPTANLSKNTQYFVTIGSSVVKDLADNAYLGITTYDFKTVASSTVDITPPKPPTFDTWFPGPTSNLIFTFNESIKVADSNQINLYEIDSYYNQIGANIAFSASVAGSTLTINPSINLVSGHKYYSGFDSGAIADLVGNTWPDQLNANGWAFTVT